jgi:hypothetical protein
MYLLDKYVHCAQVTRRHKQQRHWSRGIVVVGLLSIFGG